MPPHQAQPLVLERPPCGRVGEVQGALRGQRMSAACLEKGVRLPRKAPQGQMLAQLVLWGGAKGEHSPEAGQRAPARSDSDRRALASASLCFNSPSRSFCLVWGQQR